METLKTQWAAFLENLKGAWTETQERPWFISLKERYQELPPVAQQLVLYGFSAIVLLGLLATPISYLMDASDQNSRFDEQRQALKELMRVQREISSAPNVPVPPAPMTAKGAMDGKLAAAGVKPEQVRSAAATPDQPFMGTQEHGIEYRIEHLTIRQVLDIGYELEHVDPAFKLKGVDIIAEPTDPHFYMADYKIVGFTPKVVAEVDTSGGKGLIDAINKAKGVAPTGAPAGAAPAMPSFDKKGGN